MRATRLLIVEDHAILRDGLRTILADYPEFEILGEAEDGLEALRQCESCNPDLVLLDLTLPRLDGIDTLRRMKKKWPETAVLVLTMHRSKRALQESLAAGANGFCLKDSPIEELVLAMRSVVQGKQYISSDMQCFCEKPKRAGAVHSSADGEYGAALTGREKEILRLVAKGHTNKQIADILAISERTVDNHCTNLRSKVGVNSKQALTVHAFRAGLME